MGKWTDLFGPLVLLLEGQVLVVDKVLDLLKVEQVVADFWAPVVDVGDYHLQPVLRRGGVVWKLGHLHEGWDELLADDLVLHSGKR